jgi:hypothetical protein
MYRGLLRGAKIFLGLSLIDIPAVKDVRCGDTAIFPGILMASPMVFE